MFKIILLLLNFNNVLSYIPNALLVINNEQRLCNQLMIDHDLPCHIQSARIKNFNSAIIKMKKFNLENIYDLHDLIAFRYVFYTNSDLYKFYHSLNMIKNFIYIKNYINEPKENGYSAIHIRYKNEYNSCPVKQIECQIFLIEDYYDSLYGNSKDYKNFSLNKIKII